MRRVAELRLKLEKCRKEFKNNLIEINKVKQRIQHMRDQNMKPNQEVEESALKSRLHALWKRE